MEKLQKLEMMDKIIRELEDLKNSQTSVMKKIAQIEVDNINLGAQILEKELPDIHDKVDENVQKVSALADTFQEYRDKFYTDNKLDTLIDPTA